MLAKTLSAALEGLDALPVEVEVDISGGLPAATVVGLPDAAVKESRERVKAAIANSSYRFPNRRITINLAPADLRKEGAAYDLAMAIGLLAAAGELDAEAHRFRSFLLLGELALDGKLRAVRGALPAALCAQARGLKGIVVPPDCAAEAAVVADFEVYAPRTLAEAVGFLAGKLELERRQVDLDRIMGQALLAEGDLADVKGQAAAKRALTIAAAGGHNLLMLCRECQAAGGGLRLGDGTHHHRILNGGGACCSN